MLALLNNAKILNYIFSEFVLIQFFLIECSQNTQNLKIKLSKVSG